MPFAIRVTSLLGHAQVETAIQCLGSLRRFSVAPVTLRLHDDGTLTPPDEARLADALGGPEIVRRAAADAAIEQQLGDRPQLRKLRQQNPLFLKLLDVVLLGDDELLYCDSDVLFLRPFEDLFQLRLPERIAVFMTDRQNAYSVRSWQLLRHPRRLRLVGNLNSGIIRFPRAALDLDLLEWLVPRLSLAPVWMEQTCWAVLATRVDCRLLDFTQMTIPEPGRALPLKCVAAHFVSSVRGELGRWVNQETAAVTPAIRVESLPARRCRVGDLAFTEARRALRRIATIRRIGSSARDGIREPEER